jgi:hypothetical protein
MRRFGLWPTLLLAPLAPLFLGVASIYHPFARASGLTRLIERYATTAACGSGSLRGQTVQIGAVRWRRCVTVVADLGGLYLHVRPFGGRYAPVLIPWSDLRFKRATLLYWGKAATLSVADGPAEITLPQRLWELIQPYLLST